MLRKCDSLISLAAMLVATVPDALTGRTGCYLLNYMTHRSVGGKLWKRYISAWYFSESTRAVLLNLFLLKLTCFLCFYRCAFEGFLWISDLLSIEPIITKAFQTGLRRCSFHLPTKLHDSDSCYILNTLSIFREFCVSIILAVDASSTRIVLFPFSSDCVFTIFVLYCTAFCSRMQSKLNPKPQACVSNQALLVKMCAVKCCRNCQICLRSSTSASKFLVT